MSSAIWLIILCGALSIVYGIWATQSVLAADAGKSGLSIIVSDANAGARRLYERQGYSEIATRPMVKDSWDNPGENWVLLKKNL